jgi:hypothetical protein
MTRCLHLVVIFRKWSAKMASRAMKIDHRKGNQTERQTAPESGVIATTPAIEVLAYRLRQERGCPIGSPEVDWFRAEEEMRDGNPATD